MSRPQKGDRVRATLGGSVMVGIVAAQDSHGWYTVKIDGEVAYHLALEDGWVFEILPDPRDQIEPPVGTVVIDSEGDLWRKYDTGWLYLKPYGTHHETTEELLRCYALTILAPEWQP